MKKISKLVVLMLILTLSITALCACGDKNGNKNTDLTPSLKTIVNKYTNDGYTVTSLNSSIAEDKDALINLQNQQTESLGFNVELNWAVTAIKDTTETSTYISIICLKSEQQAKSVKSYYDKQQLPEGYTVNLTGRAFTLIMTIPNSNVNPDIPQDFESSVDKYETEGFATHKINKNNPEEQKVIQNQVESIKEEYDLDVEIDWMVSAVKEEEGETKTITEITTICFATNEQAELYANTLRNAYKQVEPALVAISTADNEELIITTNGNIVVVEKRYKQLDCDAVIAEYIQDGFDAEDVYSLRSDIPEEKDFIENDFVPSIKEETGMTEVNIEWMIEACKIDTETNTEYGFMSICFARVQQAMEFKAICEKMEPKPFQSMTLQGKIVNLKVKIPEYVENTPNCDDIYNMYKSNGFDITALRSTVPEQNKEIMNSYLPFIKEVAGMDVEIEWVIGGFLVENNLRYEIKAVCFVNEEQAIAFENCYIQQTPEKDYSINRQGRAVIVESTSENTPDTPVEPDTPVDETPDYKATLEYYKKIEFNPEGYHCSIPNENAFLLEEAKVFEEQFKISGMELEWSIHTNKKDAEKHLQYQTDIACFRTVEQASTFKTGYKKILVENKLPAGCDIRVIQKGRAIFVEATNLPYNPETPVEPDTPIEPETPVEPDTPVDETPDYNTTLEYYTKSGYELNPNQENKEYLNGMNLGIKKQFGIDVEVQWFIEAYKVNQETATAHELQITCFKTAEQAIAFKEAFEPWLKNQAEEEKAKYMIEIQGNAVKAQMMDIPATVESETPVEPDTNDYFHYYIDMYTQKSYDVFTVEKDNPADSEEMQNQILWLKEKYNTDFEIEWIISADKETTEIIYTSNIYCFTTIEQAEVFEAELNKEIKEGNNLDVTRQDNIVVVLKNFPVEPDTPVA